MLFAAPQVNPENPPCVSILYTQARFHLNQPPAAQEFPLARSLLGSTALVGQMTLLSRILGLVRDSLLAAVFGASGAMDAFVVAFRIPNFFRRLFAEGAFSQAFIPVLANYRHSSSDEELQRLIDAVFSALAIAVFGLVVVGIALAPFIITAFAPGFVKDPHQFGLGVTLLRMTFPYLLFIALTALVSGVLNTYGRFAIPALTPALLNVAFISATLYLAPLLDEPILALGIGVLVGGALQLAVQLLAVHRLGLLPRLSWWPRHPAVGRIMRLMGPAIFGVSIAQINFLVDTFLASFLQAGSISWLYYADRLMEFPLALFGIALGTVILPNLSRHYAKAETELFSDTLDWALRAVLTVTLPAAAGLAVLALPMVTTLFHYGQFGALDARMSAFALMAYAFGLTGFILVKVLAPGFYAREDTRTPVRIGVVAMVTNLVGCLLLSGPLQHAGLALATSIAAFVNSGLLWRGLVKLGVYQPRPGWRMHLLRVSFATLLMAAGLHYAAALIPDWSALTVYLRAAALGALIVAGMLVYALALWCCGVRFSDMAQPGARV